MGQGVHGPGLAIVALEAEEVDGDVRGVVESEADAEDEDDGGHDLDGQAHEVGEAADVGHAEGHGREDKNAGLEIEPTNKIWPKESDLLSHQIRLIVVLSSRCHR